MKHFKLYNEFLNEAISVKYKRDSKKVVTVYNNLFSKKLTDLGAMTQEGKLGCIKYLFELAMEDANFSREGFKISKNIKGSIGTFEIKMPGLGNYFIKIGATTTKKILDLYYSDIASAANYSGIGIVEGTALYLESIKEEAAGQALLNEFNMAFEGNEAITESTVKFNNKKVNIKSIELNGIDTNDYPDFADAYAEYAEYSNGKELTDAELDDFNDQHPDIIQELALDSFQ